MTFGDEEKSDAAISAELETLINKAREDGVPHDYLGRIIAAFYRRHGRVVPSPILPDIGAPRE